MTVINLNNNNFKEEVLNSDVPVLVDFFATWCGPCKMLSPVVDEIAENADGFKVAKVDIDQARDLAIAYGVQSVPTVAVFENGEIKKKSVGVVPKDKLLALLK